MERGAFRDVALWWLAGAVIITGLCIGLFSVGQQVYRQLMNDPQIELAENGAAALAAGSLPSDIVPHGTPLLDMAASLSPWVAVYDANGTLLEASGQLDSAPPKLPPGVFDTSQWKNLVAGHHSTLWYPDNETRFTWQPRDGVRQAVVLVATPDKKYFVASGRNMRETESRVVSLGSAVLFGWALLLAANAAVCAALWYLRKAR